MEIYGYLATVFVGISLGLLGGGGSILMVPILVYLFQIEPAVATGYSLFLVGTTALVGAFKYMRKDLVAFSAAAWFAIPSFFGVALSRAYLLPAIPHEVANIASFTITKNILVMLAFAVVMLLASASMIRGRKEVIAENPVRDLSWIIKIVSQSVVVGVVTGFVGAGGGFLIIPALVILVGIPMRTAVGTSLLIIAVNSLLGFAVDLLHNEFVDWAQLFILASISVVGIFFGMALSSRVSEAKLKQGFGWFVLVMGALILVRQIMSL